MAANTAVPETHVLAIASHVTSGYVGNTMATFCMQTLGCEVSAMHTVNYSNHVGYRRFKGRKTPPEELAELWEGLKDAQLDKFDVLLSGYCPSAATVEQVGRIARELKSRSHTKPGSFFWVLDPVMGDNGRIYVAEDSVPVYKSLLKDADLILPNQFEAELLSEVKITDLASMKQAITTLHKTHQVPHVIITSIRLPASISSSPTKMDEDLAASAKLSIIGSSATSDMEPRLFRITVDALPIFFSGTGDMFASLMVARLRQAAHAASVLDRASWRSPNEVPAVDTPLAKAAEKVLASMNAVLKDTAAFYDAASSKLQEKDNNNGTVTELEDERDLQRHLALTRVAEVRVVRNIQALLSPANEEKFKAQSITIHGKDV
ncbi:hypothetical protein LTR62_007756 [Meristemomyces frigidus]|uniref:pyridoxal kinase n=1 Tax=Meristemomyces frigidus TaxID=1508187 RepID=A0AAN7TA94_9PEZI|nr:hypothetical protein LTR62_007756 [Meristemomyces frigidus]